MEKIKALFYTGIGIGGLGGLLILNGIEGQQPLASTLFIAGTIMASVGVSALEILKSLTQNKEDIQKPPKV